MHPKNIMEFAVRESFAAYPNGGPGVEAGCRCPLCAADIQALAFSALPPRYVTRRGGLAADPAHAVAAREELERAVRQVGAHPKHAPGASWSGAAPVAVVNYPFQIGFALIEDRMRSHTGSCDCWECRCDAVAFALNRFPPQYGVVAGGTSAFPQESRKQMADELVAFLDLGVRIATAHPRHDLEP